jgi:hypothetical protein
MKPLTGERIKNRRQIEDLHDYKGFRGIKKQAKAMKHRHRQLYRISLKQWRTYSQE